MAAITWSDVTSLPGATADGLGTVHLAFQTMVLNHVNNPNSINVNAFDGEDGPDTKLARCFLAAHMCTFCKLGQGGELRAERDGKLEREYQESKSPTSYGRTAYGQCYLMMIGPQAHGPVLL